MEALVQLSLAPEPLTSNQRAACRALEKTGAYEHEAWKQGEPWLTKILGPYDANKPYEEVAAALEHDRLFPLAQAYHKDGWDSVK